MCYSLVAKGYLFKGRDICCYGGPVLARLQRAAESLDSAPILSRVFTQKSCPKLRFLHGGILPPALCRLLGRRRAGRKRRLFRVHRRLCAAGAASDEPSPSLASRLLGSRPSAGSAAQKEKGGTAERWLLSDAWELGLSWKTGGGLCLHFGGASLPGLQATCQNADSQAAVGPPRAREA